MYKDYGSYLRSRGFDKQTCDYLSRIIALEETKLNNTGGDINGDLTIEGNLDMEQNAVLDVSYIQFSNGKILSQEDISNNNIADKYDKTGGLISGNVEISGNLLLNNELQFDSVTTILKDTNNNMKLSSLYDILLQASDDVIIDASLTIINSVLKLNNNLDANQKIIQDVSSLVLYNSNNNGSLNTTEFNSTTQGEQLLSYSVNGLSNPVSLTRTSIYYNNAIYSTTIGPSTSTMILGSEQVNQMGLSIPSANIIQASSDISGQYVELYVVINITTTNSTYSFSIDISGVDAGNTFYETIDHRTPNKSGTYNLSCGPLMVLPNEFNSGNQYTFIINNLDGAFTINKTKLVIKSYFL
jgi:hypothetical protein